MKAALLPALFLFASSALLAQTQAKMNENALAAYRKADKELNDVYQQVTRRYKDDPLFLENLKSAEKAWIAFRDAQLAMKYPLKANEPNPYGSVYPMCANNYLATLTKERTKTLRAWLTGVAEGDVCAGSIQTN
ncbi:MAG TPA: lysozyme inhibitor LprI family protein [Candidatus Kapabacteria bacterium]|nr:lysozyme inhibitor LprI family protein [Candidatus Kapabacteria bacterium]